MPDVADVVPPAIDQKGNTVIWWVPASPGITALNAPKAATELGAATTFRITHSFTPDGWTLTGSQAKTTDDRLALPTPLEALDSLVNTFGDGIKYVDSSAAGSAAVVLATQTSLAGFFVERRNVSNGTLAAAAQKVRTIPVTLGPQIRGPIDGTGKFTYLQQVALTAPIVEGTTAA
ncbi:hypothetical protein [Agromyces aureus]|uniref:Phage tail protein n=1 Tax=Agromyces aureus TaxID=453304 RepID=A0A191WF63_9MICO|nr:hypothetical protein [Agromyces aureus]ANJ26819.1 hypothetical protein ATC03_08905 [Agromyces aureus]